MIKRVNKKQNLTAEQKHILHEEGTEVPGSSPLNNEKREGSYYCVGCDTKLFNSKKNMKVDQVGHLFLNHCPMCLKQKQIII